MNTTTVSRPVAAMRRVARPTRPAHRHGAWTLALHWSSAAAVLLAALTVLLREVVEGDALRAALMAAHRQAGLFVMVALVLRLAVRFTQGMTDFAAGISPWMHRLAAGAHAALYLTLLACRCWAGPPPARMASR